MTPLARFLAACRRQPVDRPPVWIMRQAGRYMPSYRALRQRASFLDLCRQPELSCEATMMAVDQLGVDAAILFSDILVPLEAMGLDVQFPEGGPEIRPAVRSAADVQRLRVDGAADALGYVYDCVGLIARTLAGRAEPLPLLGFAGAPWTLATYAVEGGTAKNKHALRRLVYDAPEVLHALLDKITQVVADYLVRQVEAGAHAVQVFDTWGGLLSAKEWQTFSLPYTTRVFEAVKKTGVPTIHYALEAPHLIGAFTALPCDVLSVDHREPLSVIRDKTGGRFALQGNVEPGVLTASPRAIRAAVAACLADYGATPGHIMNLGHGITPDATVDAARLFVDTVKELG
ncbi:MAG: uroporphyrinogen decarboxylase [Myxococcota bacterium]